MSETERGCDDGSVRTALLALIILTGCGRTALVPPGIVRVEVCGDGVVNTGESCDDGNADDTDACLTSCDDARCGDGVIWQNRELCDPGPLSVDAGGTCNANCTVPSCGNGNLEGIERCDDGVPALRLEGGRSTRTAMVARSGRCRSPGGGGSP